MRRIRKAASGILALVIIFSMPLSAAAADISAPLSEANSIVVTNNPEGTADTVEVGELAQGDIVKVYADDILTIPIGAAMADETGAAAVAVPQLIPFDAAGIVYMTVIRTGFLESEAYPVHVTAANASDPLAEDNPVSVTSNSSGTNDFIAVAGLDEGDIVSVYGNYLLTVLIGAAAADASGTAVVSVPQLIENDNAGDVYLTVVRAGAPESDAVMVFVPAAGITAALSAVNTVTVTNNAAGTSDTVVVTGLLQGDIIRVYTDDALTALIGSATAPASGTAKVTIAQIYPGDAAGTIYITVTNIGKLESVAVPFAVPTTGTSAPVNSVYTVSATNNAAGISDMIVVEGLAQGDKVKVYADEQLTALLGTATAAASGIAAVVIAQIFPGDVEGYVYITITSPAKPESTAIRVFVPAADASAPLTEEDNAVTIKNNAGSSDSIVIEGLDQGDRIKVYSDATLMNPIGTAAANALGTATLTVAQLTAGDGAGYVYITVTKTGKLESPAFEAAVPSAGATAPLSAANTILVTNRAGGSDTIVINGLAPGDKIKVYSDHKLTNLLGSGTAGTLGTAALTIAQLIALDAEGDVYITVTGIGKQESIPYTVHVTAAGVTPALTAVNPIDVRNNAAGTNDTVTVTGLAQGDRIKVYADENLTNLLGTAAASGVGKATVTVAQLTAMDMAGSVYITVTGASLLESAAYEVSVPAAQTTAPLSSFNTITVTNNAAGTNDTVAVTRLAQGDKIKVYTDASLALLLGSATAAAAGSVVVKVPQLTPDDEPGTVYITVTNVAATESTAVPAAVPGVGMTPGISGFNTVTITNNTAGISDTVVVTGLSQNDKIKVYADSALTVLLGSASAGASGVAAAKIAQLIPNDASGTVYITVTGTAELESAAYEAAVPSANASQPLSTFNMFTVTNNAAGTNDTIVITRLAQGDLIKVYADIACAVLLGSAKAAAAGAVTVKVPQLTPNDAVGVVYVTVTNAGRLESTAYAIPVPAAGASLPLSPANVYSVTNNAAGTSDVIVIGGLSQNDKIRIYTDSALKSLLGYATAAATGMAAFKTPQLTKNDEDGTVYITVTYPSAQESTAIAVSVPAAFMTAPLSVFSSITVTNNALGTNDTIVISMLAQGDKIRVYSDAGLGKLLGSATAAANGTATVKIAQLIPNDGTGSVYATVTNAAARESAPYEIAVPPVRTTAPLHELSAIIVTNNALGTNDTIVIEGLAQGDKIKVYADERLTALLGAATATAAGIATLKIKQLAVNDNEDSVFITVTNMGAKESTAFEVDIPAAGTSVPLTPDNTITVVNNALGTSDTVAVDGLDQGDRIKVYADSRLTALLGSGTAAASGSASLKIPQLIAGDGEGTVYVTVTRVGRFESTAVSVDISAAGGSAPLSELNTVAVTNNAVGKSDTIVITGLLKSDKIKVYSDGRLINLLGSATANASGTATVSVSQLIAGDAAGTVYVTVTSVGLLPSAAVTVAVPMTGTSAPLTSASDIAVTNNAVGRSDTITISGLIKGDKIKVYSDSKMTRLLGSATVGASGSVTVTVKQLIANDAAGFVYITVTGAGLLESIPYAVAVPPAGQSDPIR